MRIAHLTDTHLKPDAIAEEGFANALKSANNLSPKADFIINGGDAIMDALEKSKEEVKKDGWKETMRNEESIMNEG